MNKKITVLQLKEYINNGKSFKLACSSPTFEYGGTLAICFNATAAIISPELRTITLMDNSGNKSALFNIEDISVRCSDNVKILLDIICNSLDGMYKYRLDIYR